MRTLDRDPPAAVRCPRSFSPGQVESTDRRDDEYRQQAARKDTPIVDAAQATHSELTAGVLASEALRVVALRCACAQGDPNEDALVSSACETLGADRLRLLFHAHTSGGTIGELILTLLQREVALGTLLTPLRVKLTDREIEFSREGSTGAVAYLYDSAGTRLLSHRFDRRKGTIEKLLESLCLERLSSGEREKIRECMTRIAA